MYQTEFHQDTMPRDLPMPSHQRIKMSDTNSKELKHASKFQKVRELYPKGER